MNADDELLKNLDKLHTTELGVERIKRNLFLDTDDVVGWCKAKFDSVKAVITRSGKNWYVNVDNCIITVRNEMKSKVGAIKISIIAIIVSFIFYIECQTNFHVCYMILRSIVHIINVMMEKRNMTDSYLFYKGRDIYAWLLNQPGSVEIKCIEMISSGVFGSTIVTLMVYYVEYKIQLKDAIHELINIQKKHVEQLNNLTYVSAFIDDENDIKRKTYLEYSENSLKLRGKERLEKQLNGRKNLIKAKKRKILNSNSQRLFQFQHKYDKKYRELVWTSIPKEKKKSLWKKLIKMLICIMQ